MLSSEQSGWKLPRLARENPSNQSLKNSAITSLIFETNCQAFVFAAHRSILRSPAWRLDASLGFVPKEKHTMRYVSHLACTVCGTTFSAETPMNLRPHDGLPIQVLIDLDRLKAECGRDGWWNPARRDLWRFGGLLPLDINDAGDSRSIVTLGEGCTPSLAYAHSLADRVGFRLEVKDERRHQRGFGANPTLSFKDRGMAMAVSDKAIRTVIHAQWQERRFAWSPEGAATLAAIPELVDRGFIRPGDRVVLVNTASAEKYLPALRTLLDGGL